MNGNRQRTTGAKACTSYGGFLASQLAFALPDPYRNCTIDPVSAIRSNGFFGDVPPITYASITDGLSQTLIVADKSVTALQMINDPSAPYLSEQNNWWVDGQLGQTTLSGAFPPNVFKRKPSDLSHTAAWLWSASSLHPGGVNGLMADGAVRFIRETIDASPLEPSQARPHSQRARRTLAEAYQPKRWRYHRHRQLLTRLPATDRNHQDWSREVNALFLAS